MNSLLRRLQTHFAGRCCRCGEFRSGRTVEIPAGTCSWTSTLAIAAKSITLQGAGVDQTIIIDPGRPRSMRAAEVYQNSFVASGTAGVAYWATDQGEWDSTRAGPDGQLYKCSSANGWTAFYTPYAYPHPLVSGTVLPPSIASSAPRNLGVVR